MLWQPGVARNGPVRIAQVTGVASLVHIAHIAIVTRDVVVAHAARAASLPSVLRPRSLPFWLNLDVTGRFESQAASFIFHNCNRLQWRCGPKLF